MISSIFFSATAVPTSKIHSFLFRGPEGTISALQVVDEF